MLDLLFLMYQLWIKDRVRLNHKLLLQLSNKILLSQLINLMEVLKLAFRKRYKPKKVFGILSVLT